MEGIDLGVIGADIIQEADRTFVAGGDQHPSWAFTNAQCTELEDRKKNKSQGRRQRSNKVE